MTIPPGWKLVPNRPTEKMIDAGERAVSDHIITDTALAVYRAMCAAAPPSPEPTLLCPRFVNEKWCKWPQCDCREPVPADDVEALARELNEFFEGYHEHIYAPAAQRAAALIRRQHTNIRTLEMQSEGLRDALRCESSECARLRSRLERCEAALRPFALQIELIECTTEYEYRDDEEWPDCAAVKIGDLRRARAALREQEQP